MSVITVTHEHVCAWCDRHFDGIGPYLDHVDDAHLGTEVPPRKVYDREDDDA